MAIGRWNPYGTRFALQDPGDLLYAVPPPPPAPVPKPRVRPRIRKPPVAVENFTPAYDPSAQYPGGVSPPLSGPGVQRPTPPPSGATPPVGGVVKPTVTATGPAAPTPTEDDDVLRAWERLFPPDRDYLAEARKRLGAEPARVGEMQISPFEAAAMLLPTIMGSPAGSAAAVTGAMGGYLGRKKQAAEEAEKYGERAANLAEKIEGRETQRGLALMPYLTEKAGERRRGQISEARLRLDQQRESFNQSLRSAQFAFDQFKWANPSAYQEQTIRLRDIDQRIRDAHYRAQEALTEGRMDEYARHNRAVEDLTRQARDLTRQQIDIARQRVREGGPTQALALFRFVEQQAQSLQGELDYAIDPERRRALEDDLKYYRGVQEQLRPQIVGEATRPRGGAAGPSGRTYPLKTRPGETATSAEVQQMIRQALKAGRSRAEIRAALEADGIDPANFGF